MVRETRHLWVGNLPDNIRDDRIREHFKRYGRVQNVKLLGRTDAVSSITSGASGVCATVAFMDIKSASKAHNAEHVLDERTLTTEYYEPAAIPISAGAPSAGSSPAGSGYSGSSSSVNSAPAPTPASRYHLSGGEDSASSTCPIAASAAAPATWRGTNDSATEYCRRGNTPAAYGRYQRNNSTASYSTPPSNVERTTPHHRWYSTGDRTTGATGGESTPSTPGGGTESGRRRRHSGSGSSRSDSSSPEPSDTSRASTPAAQPPLSHHANHRTPSSLQHQWASMANGRPLAICVRNLPTRSTDSSLKDGLYHEYKKHGKVVWVKVVGQNADRYAVVRFKKPSDVEKALEVSQDKLFFGCKISVAPHQSCEEDADSAKPYETDIDEYHPKATRTLFIGNLEKDVTQQQLRDKFKHFGRIIEIDIKKGSGGGAGYAFCQYASISSVVEAIRAMDGEYVGGSRVKLGFGKPVATTCVWVDGLTEHTEKQVLGAVSRCGAATSVCVDRAAGAALVHFEQAAAAGAAVRELRRVAAAASATDPDHPRLCVDYASRECQEAFYEQLEKHGGSAALTGSERLSGDITGRYLPTTRHEPLRYDGGGSRSRASSYGRGSSRTPRYSTLEHYDPADYAADRRYRVYDEVGSSPQNEETPYEDRLQSVVVSPHHARKHRRDSSPEDRKHSKERHRSVGGVGVSRRSRSGSRGSRHIARRRHRRRRDGSGSRGSRTGSPLRGGTPLRAGTPLRDEPDALPAEPRRPPRERPPLPMSLPLPRFAAQLLRAVPPAPRPAPAPAPDSPPRPPSASSSSAGSAPHSPSLEERIRSLDEKYEKWSGSRALSDAPDRARLRHRLLDVDINEVKPSEVMRSLLAKRSVFDEDSERLEGAGRAASPASSPRGRPGGAPRVLRYPFPVHPPPPPDSDRQDTLDRPHDPRLNRPERLPRFEKLGKFNESDYRHETRTLPRTPSPERSHRDERRSPVVSDDREDDLRTDNQKRNSESLSASCESESKSSFDCDMKDSGVDSTYKINDCATIVEKHQVPHKEISQSRPVSTNLNVDSNIQVEKEEATARDVMDMLLKSVEKSQNVVSHNDNRYVCSNENISANNFDFYKKDEGRVKLGNEHKGDSLSHNINETEKCNDFLVHNYITKELLEFEMQHNHLNTINCLKSGKEETELTYENNKVNNEKNGKERYMHHSILEVYHNTRFEKENIQIDKTLERDKHGSNSNIAIEKRGLDIDIICDETYRNDRDKSRHSKERTDKDKNDTDKLRSTKSEKVVDKHEKKGKEDQSFERIEKIKKEQDAEKLHRDKNDREGEKTKHSDEKPLKADHQKKDKIEKDKRKDACELEQPSSKVKREDKYKQDKSKKDNNEAKRDIKKESEVSKSRKSSRDETSREISRKDSTDSSTSRASHESIRQKEIECNDVKEESKSKMKYCDIFGKHETDKDIPVKHIDAKVDIITKQKIEVKDEKVLLAAPIRPKDTMEKQRHYSLDSPSLDSKRKERLNSCSSLPCNIGHKRRMSSQDSFDYLHDDVKKSKNEGKLPERRESKDSRNSDRHKPTKFSKGHFAKIIESKTKDDKKSQVKPPDDTNTEYVKNKTIDKNKIAKRSPKFDSDEKMNTGVHQEGLHNDLDFLATLELRSSEEDERQKALRKEMKEKKRIQQLQQIQELQMQHDAMQQAEILGKAKDDKRQKSDEKRKEAAREKRMSTDRKSRDEKYDCMKRKNRKPVQSSDSSDSDEPKKHSIFDIIDDGPTYISMYDKVKARSCKNMQKQEEEKRQEKIKAKFCQLKQSRAKREEKKRSSWDEDSESDQDRNKTQKSSMENTSDDDNIAIHNKRREKHLDYERRRSDEYFELSANEMDLRNKLSRKNSRTRIMSDSSDDEIKHNDTKSHNYLNDVKKELTLNSEALQRSKDDFKCKDTNDDKLKKNTLLSLFGKSDSDDSRLKSSLHEMENDYKPGFVKSMLNDFSSESESVISNRHLIEMRKKHKKKQKKHKSYSDDETKVDNSDTSALETETKFRNMEKRRHSNKKDKRKDKNRESVDTDDNREDRNKIRRERKSNSFDFTIETVTNNLKKDGKMEDIFGPLSDESDKDSRPHQINNKSDFLTHEFNSSFCANDQIAANTEIKLKEKEDNKRKKEKKRKDKRYSRDDDNSLDVDAVSKAIEARLFAESLGDEENRIRSELPSDIVKKINHSDIQCDENDMISDILKNDVGKKECKEKRKKKKRSKEDRLVRKDIPLYHSDKFDKQDHDPCENTSLEYSTKTLLDIPLPTDSLSALTEKSDDTQSLSESHSLPRLTDSPPIIPTTNETKISSDILEGVAKDNERINQIEFDRKDIEVDKIPMPPSFDNTIEDISEVPLPKDPVPILTDLNKLDVFMPTFGSDKDINEDAVRSISNLQKEPENTKPEKCSEKENHNKLEKKVEEKPRAVISQEETEDAVAALLGESFGGKINAFTNCYEETEKDIKHQNENENIPIETEIIPEEDAEEMRQAVQNLNASEMEIKPDTPVSDNDLLLIDTDNEETEETPQDSIERLPLNIIATTQSLTTTTKQSKTTEVLSNIVTPKTKVDKALNIEGNQPDTTLNESDTSNQLAKRENVKVITSSATPVITSWNVTNNKTNEPKLLNIEANPLSSREKSEKKTTHITPNIVQIKSPQNQRLQLNSSLLPIMPPARGNSPNQVINHIIRPQTPNLQPPTIKIPESHIIYQKQPGIVISPRMSNDQRLHSPIVSPKPEGLTSPRLSNMTILNNSQQNVGSVGLTSPNAMQQRSSSQVTVNTIEQRSPGQVTVNAIQQRSPGQVTVNAIQQRTPGQVSVNAIQQRSPSQVTVNTIQQRPPGHVTVNAIQQRSSGQVTVNAIQQRPPGQVTVNAIQQRSPGQVTVVRMQQPPLSPIQALHLPHGARTLMSPNRPNSVLVQTQGTPLHINRLPVTPVLAPISKQISVNNILPQNKGIGGSSASLHQQKISPVESRKNELRNIADNVNENTKIIISPTSWQQNTNPTVLAQNRLISMQNNHNIGNANPSTQLTNKVLINNINHLNEKRENLKPEYTTPIIQVNHCKATITPNVNKGSNVIHTLNSKRLITSVPISNVIQIDTNKGTPSVLSMATIKPTVLMKTESSISPAVTTITSTTVTSSLMKTNELANSENFKTIIESEGLKSSLASSQNNGQHKKDNEDKICDLETIQPNFNDNLIPSVIPFTENISKCETDFEELLKDNTNKIKITNDPENKLEVNVGKALTLFPAQIREKQKAFDMEELSNETAAAVSLGQSQLQNYHEELHTKNDDENKKPFIVIANTIAGETDPTTKGNNNSNIQTDKLFTNLQDVTIKSPNLSIETKCDEPSFLALSEDQNDSNDSPIKTLDENDSWSAKDVNIESVIKKVDSLCNETLDLNEERDQVPIIHESKDLTKIDETKYDTEDGSNNPINEPVLDSNVTIDTTTCKVTNFSKRGGRSGRGKKNDKSLDRTQTRQITKPLRGTNSKRGRGRAKVDKKIKNLVNTNTNSIPGDVYDFHEDSGDETPNSPNKNESRPRLILTIKSPLSGHANMIATSTLSIKDQIKNPDKITKDEKHEDFISPSPNTRKSRRLQEKDVQKTTVDEVIEDVIKGNAIQAKGGKDLNKKKQLKPAIVKCNLPEKAVGIDTRKSPRGAKRTRDRSLSDGSIDSGDERVLKREAPKEPKVARLEGPNITVEIEPDPPAPARTALPLAHTALPLAHTSLPLPHTSPSTPIMKPPKKMISEISAKLACAFEAAATAPPPPAEPEPQPLPDPLAAATGRLPDNCTPVGATEATDARVQSPALPHRPPSTHRPTDRATPVLIRGSEVDGNVAGAGCGVSAGLGAAGVSGAVARGYRGYAATASLPRGAHHPPAPEPHPHLKQRAVPGQHYHHPSPAAGSRVTITSVPAISPQGQIGVTVDLVRSPPPAHQQTSPVTAGDGMYPHFSHQHYQMYQQHFRATQHESRATPSPYSRALEAEGSEAPAPLELRRPLSARVPRPAHSPSPADRLIMYAVGCARSPPPAHGRAPGPPGPPHASQVPREADSLQMLLRRYPVMWQGLLALKNDSAAVQMHFVGGSPGVAAEALSRHADLTPLLRIAQRMRLEPAQLDQVHRKMKMENEHCMLLALPCGRDHMDVLQQSTNLTAGFITYLQRKQAAGIVNVALPGHHQAMYTVHIFPSCEFANENLTRIAPDLMHRVADIAHLLIVIATV